MTVTAQNITLIPGASNKAPDGHLTLNPRHIPLNLLPSYPTNPRTGLITPQLVLEVAVGNESMPRHTQTDLDRCFAAGTGTRAWIGIKIFKDDRNNPPRHRWWTGHAHRDFVNGAFLDSATFHPESMPIVPNHNALLSNAVTLVFFSYRCGPIDHADGTSTGLSCHS